MSEDSLQFDPHALRRTLSTGDIPSREIPRQRVRINASPPYPMQEAPAAAPAAPDPDVALAVPDTQPYQTWYGRTLAFFGYGRRASKARRALVSLIWNLSWGVVQFVFIVALLAYSIHQDSPTIKGINEWHACDKPLGIWNCLWVIRILLACGHSYWSWCRDRKARSNETDIEATAPTSPRPSTTPTTVRDSTAAEQRSTGQSAPNPSGSSEGQPHNALPYSHLYARLSLLSSLMTLTWFLTAHILEYTSINTCRHSSPHLWWLTFGILCIMYLMVLEVFILGFVVFIMAPLLFLFWNIILLCLGRHPVQNPHMIKPEIGKLPKSIVDRIPLVVYIPPPPDEPAGTPKMPEAIYTYPPKLETSTLSPKKRFAFLKKIKGRKARRSGSNDDGNEIEKSAKHGNEEPQTWEDHWEQGEYPFVRLEGNRAACAICLMDFEEPKRAAVAGTRNDRKFDGEKPSAHVPSVSDGAVQEIPLERIRPEDQETELKLEDAGEGAQPLRLLACGHVFHKTCLDPWLVDVSGRCPVCQRPVELPEPGRKKKSSRQ